MTSKLDAIQTSVTNRIIESLEQDLPPWVCPWDKTAALNLPINAKSKKAYGGSNVLNLWLSSLDGGFKSKQWLTFLQIKEAKAKLKKGSKGTRIITYRKVSKKCEKTEEEKSYSFFKESIVFNLDQVEGLAKKYYEADEVPSLTDFEIHSKCEQIIKNSNADITEKGNQAFYRPSTDQIMIPNRLTFNTANDFYKTIIHELAHWTMHADRCDREVQGIFNRESYAYEELIAELTTVFISSHIGLDGLVNHSSYIKSWLQALRNDKTYIFKAASQASKATAFLLNFLDDKEEEEKEE